MNAIAPPEVVLDVRDLKISFRQDGKLTLDALRPRLAR